MDLIVILLIVAVVGIKASPSPYYSELELIESKLYTNKQPPIKDNTPPQPAHQPQPTMSNPQPMGGNIPPKPQTPQMPKPPMPRPPMPKPPAPPSNPQPKQENTMGDFDFGQFNEILGATLDESAFSELSKDR